MRGSRFLETEPVGRLYEWFATETAATSPTWEALSRWIARTPEVHSRLDDLPGQARQPNRFLAALRFLGGPTEPGAAFVAWLDDNWAEVERIVLSRTTQTNEPGRCAVVAPVLASLPQPIALVELGASAGLCLLPDRYAYSHDGDPIRSAAAAPDAPEFPCRVTGAPPGDPRELTVAARAGVDLNPLDPTDPDTRRWLRALVWPGEEDREERLAAALHVAAEVRPRITRADLTQDPATVISAAVDTVRQQAPSATPVIVHSAFLAYLSRDDRQAVVDAIRGSGAHWVSMEGPRVVPGLDPSSLGPMPEAASFLIALDGEPLGWAQAHGRSVHWGAP
ncbi:hypothetical protein GCM10025789_00160 [Tessaracoccus lubricantis]|uniref:DUF2332 domain-containing protein n=1 Tax=Tessaracoccus lubricantis TaxID=545543 RepID=A0ABP9EV01_9ACTN